MGNFGVYGSYSRIKISGFHVCGASKSALLRALSCASSSSIAASHLLLLLGVFFCFFFVLFLEVTSKKRKEKKVAGQADSHDNAKEMHAQTQTYTHTDAQIQARRPPSSVINRFLFCCPKQAVHRRQWRGSVRRGRVRAGHHQEAEGLLQQQHQVSV